MSKDEDMSIGTDVILKKTECDDNDVDAKMSSNEGNQVTKIIN